MQINLTFEPEFDQLYNNYNLTPERSTLLELEGISRDKLDVGKMSHAYFTKRLADITVDQNANANEATSPNNYSAEVVKGIMKIEGYYLLWKYSKKRYGLRVANKLMRAIWDGDLYFHDPTGIQVPYCWAFSTTPLMIEGRPYGQLQSLPPKRADSFIAQVVETTMDLSQEFVGAIAPSDVLVNYAWYAKKEGKSDKEIVNDLQKMVHVFNNKFRVSGQSVKFDTLILVDNKWVKIGEFVDKFTKDKAGTIPINEDHYTISFDTTTGEISRNKIYAVSKHKRKNPLMKVTLRTGQEIVVTSDHSLFTLSEDSSIEECTPSSYPDNILVPVNFANDTNNIVNISEYALEHTTPYNKAYNEILLTNKIMYLIGYYLGKGICDGSVLELKIHDNKLEEWFVNNFSEFTPHRHKGRVRLNVGEQFCRWLEATFGRRSYDKRIPVEFSLKENSLYLIAGYIDAEGATDGIHYNITSNSEQLIKDVQFTLQAHGLLSIYKVKQISNYTHKNQRIYQLYISNDYTCKIPCICCKVDFQNIPTPLIYDLTNIKHICQKILNQISYNWDNIVIRYDVIDLLIKTLTEIVELPYEKYFKTTSLDKGVVTCSKEEAEQLLIKVKALYNVVPIKVESIELLEDEDEFVYDISVENNENFLAAKGIFAHNSPFTNISLFDRKNLKTVWDNYRYPDGSELDIEWIMRIQKLFGGWFAKGDPATGLPYRFPVVSVNLSVDDNNNPTDEDFLDWLSEVNIDKGVFNIYANDGTKIASCCRLSNDFERMKYRVDAFGGGGLNIGSHRVVTVNLPRLGLLANGDQSTFFKVLDNVLEKAKKLLLVHRENLLMERIENGNGFLQFFNPLRWFNLEHLFSTVGIVGVYETNYFMGYDIKSDEGIEFTTKLLKHIEHRLEQFSDETKHSFNCEEIPAESTAATLALKDKIYLGESVQPFNLYSNQYIPLIHEASMLERIKLTGKFMNLLSGGGILHLNMSDQIHTKEQMKKLIKVAIKNGVENFAINYGFAICEDGHVSIAGNSTACPLCGKPIVDYMTRVIGYFTKVSSWNAIRRDYEYPRRKFMPLEETKKFV